jgi:ABC-type glycerol-3-phosphate transport system substrate-binding protein
MKMLMVIVAALVLAACGGEGPPIGSSTNAASESEGSGSNNSISNAQSIQSNSETSGNVGPNDVYDYYEFSAQEGAVVRINLAGESGNDIDLFLYLEGQLVDSSESSGNIETIIFTMPTSGTLQVGVKYYSGIASDYSLTVDAE